MCPSSQHININFVALPIVIPSQCTCAALLLKHPHIEISEQLSSEETMNSGSVCQCPKHHAVPTKIQRDPNSPEIGYGTHCLEYLGLILDRALSKVFLPLNKLQPLCSNVWLPGSTTK